MVAIACSQLGPGNFEAEFVSLFSRLGVTTAQQCRALYERYRDEFALVDGRISVREHPKANVVLYATSLIAISGASAAPER